MTRTAPLAIVAIAASLAGVTIATEPGRAERRVLARYVSAWAHEDFAQMYSLLDPASRRRTPEPKFEGLFRRAAATATLLRIETWRVGSKHGDFYPVAVRLRTRLFGTLRGTLDVPLARSGSAARIIFSPSLAFPGLGPGEHLSRKVRLAPRAALLASDGTPLAVGPGRTSPIPDVAAGIVGVLGPIPRAQRALYAAQGYPANAKVGLDGLEEAFDTRLAGTPGGELLAGGRVLARHDPAPGLDVRTTIEPSIERAVLAALAGRFGGIVAMDPRTGAVLAAAGIAFSAPQPPGSTMKIITATGALEAGIVKLGDTFPVATSATIGGYQLNNANGEACGGTLLEAFAVSCNSVFAPLGVTLGAARLVRIAELFGFNQPPPLPGSAESVIPSAATIGGDVAVGSSAIGQGLVQATTLEMTDVAATIAMGGRRPIPTLLAGQRPRFVRVTTPRIAGLVQRMMVAVVSFGTGTAAQIPGVGVAGKTGTAQLRNAPNPTQPNANAAQDTDAWFVAYATVRAPRIVVGALFPAQGSGAGTAAPAVHDVLVAALKRH